ncbi:MAG: prolyl oligopeptidase family serine peptidase [Bacteroidales bacterium]|nr:prolyl oligopeptidase family serine peptidase [Bacteroidales bacterium]
MKSTSKTLLFFLFLAYTATIAAQETKKVLNVDDYDRWSRITSVELSDNGSWMSYAYSPNDGDDTLYIKNISSGKVYSDEYCTSPEFSNDSKWVIYKRELQDKKAEKLRKSKKPVYAKGVLLELESGNKTEWDKTDEIEFSPGSGFVVIKKEKGKDKQGGADLLLKNLSTGALMNIGNVDEYKFNKKSTYLAYTVNAEDNAGNGLYLMDLKSSKLIALDTDTLLYSKLTWDDEMLYDEERGQKGTAIAVLKGNKPDSLEQRINKLLVFSNINKADPERLIYDPAADNNFPGDYVLSEMGKLAFSLDNKRMMIGIKEQEKVKKMSRDTIPNVDVWHWDDEQIQSVQKVRNRYTSRSTYDAILHLDKLSFVQIESDDMRNSYVNRNADRIIGANPKPYIADTNWGGGYSDYYMIDPATGDKKLVEKKIGRVMGLSPDGNHFLYFKNGHFYDYDLAAEKLSNISENVKVSFMDIEEDHPYENPSYGLAGWSADKKTVFLNHQYDLWAVSLDGSGGYNLTGNYGTDNKIRFRFNRAPGRRYRIISGTTMKNPYLDLEEDLYLTAFGKWSKKSGYFELKDGKDPEELIFEDASYGRLTQAEDADRFIFTRQTFVDFPDYYTVDLRFRKPERMTNANPQQAEYKWGRRILVEYENKHGDKLQGTLTLPADYEEGKKYPMLVYFYEKMSDRHHSYSMPRYDDRPHMSTYASNGYLVLMPDIQYYEGKPGWNALDCITAATQKVIDKGYADPEHIGLQGHSWGGYQSSFILTQTDMFACVVTGAPVTNLTSMYNILYKNSGTNNHGIFEKGQVRMGKGMFDDMENYIAQSPVQNAPGIKTPFMILHGTVDGAVDWNQGLEFYNAARRLGKEVILLSYPDENHHLANKYNQIDFQVRMKQFFDHYLMDKPAPEWMKKGIEYKDKLYNKAK